MELTKEQTQMLWDAWKANVLPGEDFMQALVDAVETMLSASGFVSLHYQDEMARLLSIAEARVKELERMRTHCENCGADYMATGIEAGCPCLLKAEIVALRKQVELLSAPVSNEQQYFYSILVVEGLADWKLKIATDAYCWIKRKEIQLPADCCMALFLHEVAHALYPEPEGEAKNHYHGGNWAYTYGQLVNKWMRFNDALPISRKDAAQKEGNDGE